jgi:hypothetical protein
LNWKNVFVFGLRIYGITFYWIYLALDKAEWRPLAQTVMKLQASYNAATFSASGGTVNFPGRL